MAQSRNPIVLRRVEDLKGEDGLSQNEQIVVALSKPVDQTDFYFGLGENTYSRKKGEEFRKAFCDEVAKQINEDAFFVLPPDIKKKLTDNDNAGLYKLIDKSFKRMNYHKSEIISRVDQQSIFFDFFKFVLPFYIIMQLNPQSVDFEVNVGRLGGGGVRRYPGDRVRVGCGVSSAYFNLMHSFECQQPLNQAEFESLLSVDSSKAPPHAIWKALYRYFWIECDRLRSFVEQKSQEARDRSKGCSLFLMSTPVSGRSILNSDLNHLYLYKDDKEKIFYQINNKKFYLKDEKNETPASIKVLPFNQPEEEDRRVKCNDLMIGVTVLNITLKRGHTYLFENDPKLIAWRRHPSNPLNLGPAFIGPSTGIVWLANWLNSNDPYNLDYFLQDLLQKNKWSLGILVTLLVISLAFIILTFGASGIIAGAAIAALGSLYFPVLFGGVLGAFFKDYRTAVIVGIVVGSIVAGLFTFGIVPAIALTICAAPLAFPIIKGIYQSIKSICQFIQKTWQQKSKDRSSDPQGIDAAQERSGATHSISPPGSAANTQAAIHVRLTTAPAASPQSQAVAVASEEGREERKTQIQEDSQGDSKASASKKKPPGSNLFSDGDSSSPGPLNPSGKQEVIKEDKGPPGGGSAPS